MSSCPTHIDVWLNENAKRKIYTVLPPFNCKLVIGASAPAQMTVRITATFQPRRCLATQTRLQKSCPVGLRLLFRKAVQPPYVHIIYVYIYMHIYIYICILKFTHVNPWYGHPSLLGFITGNQPLELGLKSSRSPADFFGAACSRSGKSNKSQVAKRQTRTRHGLADAKPCSSLRYVRVWENLLEFLARIPSKMPDILSGLRWKARA